MKLVRETPFSCTLPKEDSMRVLGTIYVNTELEQHLDTAAVEQVKNVAALPGIVRESIAMPDIHRGYGFPVGGVAAFDEKTGIISPGGIGFDINCGVRLLATDAPEDDVRRFLPELLELLDQAVPSGTGRESSIRLTHTELDEVLREGAGWAQRKGYATDDDLERTEERGYLEDADPADVSHQAKDRGVNQLGTLGGGNHFLEVQRVENVVDAEKAATYGLREGQVVVLIHCGSRGVGHQVCSDYIKLIEEEYPEVARSLPEKNLVYAPIASRLGQRYRRAMAAAANYAWCNRQILTHHVRKAFARLFPGSSVSLVYDVSHNIAKFEEHTVEGEKRRVCVHRKGATRSFGPGHPDVPTIYRASGQPVLVPGSMGTASWVLAGAPESMRRTFGSCCHGAGRRMSRSAAMEQLDGRRIVKELKERGITIKAGSVKGVAEEAPQVYKDVDEVIRVVTEAGIAVPVARLVPLGVLKG
jgi:tRNA-splicing ligase RtcB